MVCELCKKKKKLPEDKAIIIKTMEATTPELKSVRVHFAPAEIAITYEFLGQCV